MPHVPCSLFLDSPQCRVESIAQAVAKQVEADHQQRKEQRRVYHQMRIVGPYTAGVREQCAQGSGLGRTEFYDAKETQGAFLVDNARDDNAQEVIMVPRELGNICFQIMRLSLAPSVLAAITYS